MATVHLGDIDISYELHGAGDPVVLVHGLGSSPRDWEQQVPAFADHYRVLTYDVRGHGRTSMPLIPGAVLKVIADSRHATPMERPEAFNAVLRDFFDAQTAR